MKKRILILTNPNEIISPVLSELDRRDASYDVLYPEQFPTSQLLSLSLNKEGVRCIKLGKKVINLSAVKTVWYRKTRPPEVNDVLEEESQRFAYLQSKAALWSLFTTLDARWINPPLIEKYLVEDNKMYQMKVAQSVGLLVPPSIVTNDLTQLKLFAKKFGSKLAMKPVYSVIFTDNNQKPVYLYTQQLDISDLEGKEESILLAPMLYQQYIPKKYELRVTVVGSKIFACAIDSQSSPRTLVDWRKYDFENVAHTPAHLPKTVSHRILKLLEVMGLQFGAIDMIVTPRNNYYFLEVNPSGQWLWIERLTGQPISKAIAELLTL